jgi:periplasmic protein TonB
MMILLLFLSANAAVEAMPLNDPTTWILESDYPREMLDRRLESSVGILLYVDKKGYVRHCIAEKRSEIVKLNAHTCFIITARAKFEAFSGIQKYRTYRTKVNWALPISYKK